MQQNTTDHIASLAWNTLKKEWRAFLLLPAGFLILFLLLALLFTSGGNWEALGEQNVTPPNPGLLVPLQLIEWVFLLVYSTALTKWCSELHGGKKKINIAEGLRYGLSQFWGVLWTLIVTGVKLVLWTLLFILPGFYKGLCYSQSLQIAQLEKISGDKANRLSQTLIKEAGILRTLGNFISMVMISYLSIIPVAFVIMIIGITGASIPFTTLLFSVIIVLWIVCFIVYLATFSNYQYLLYRDENKAKFTAALKKVKTS